MEQVIVSSRFQINLPLDLRKKMKFKAGQKLMIDWDENRIEIVPDISYTELKGYLKGIDTNIERESDYKK